MVRPFVWLAPLALLSTAAAPPPGEPVEAIRYHLGTAIAPGTVSVEPLSSATSVSPEFQAYADAVSHELAALKFTSAAADAKPAYVAHVLFVREDRGPPPRPGAGVSVGGATGGYGSGFGVGLSIPIRIGKPRHYFVTTLKVQLTRASDNSVVWEGNAVTGAMERSRGDSPDRMAARLAGALFKGFPGQSGVTITVK